MSRRLRDSYTGQEIGDIYLSPIVNIERGRSLFKSAEWDSAEYESSRMPDGRWYVERRASYGYPEMPVGIYPSEAQASKIADWLVRHDAGVREAVFQVVGKGDWAPYLAVVKRAEEITS